MTDTLLPTTALSYPCTACDTESWLVEALGGGGGTPCSSTVAEAACSNLGAVVDLVRPSRPWAAARAESTGMTVCLGAVVDGAVVFFALTTLPLRPDLWGAKSSSTSGSSESVRSGEGEGEDGSAS